VTAEIVERVLRSSRYREVDRTLLARLAAEELPRARNADDAVKRVKRRLHQAVGAFRGATRNSAISRAWSGDLMQPAFRAACADALRAHASTRERVPHVDAFYAGIWAHTGLPARVLDLGCGLGPLALPWMGLAAGSTYVASDVDRRPLATVAEFLALVGQAHRIDVRDLVADLPTEVADIALLLKLVTTLDRQDPEAAARLLRRLRVRHAVVSFTARSLGGRGKGMERTYRDRMERLVADAGRVRAVAEASVPNELVFVLSLNPPDG
jgi:16S rRNA (guanine(1405)-N(7))-methyltransferase